MERHLVTCPEVACLLEKSQKKYRENGILDGNIRVDVSNMSHQVGQSSVVTALIGSTWEWKLGILQLQELFNFSLVLSEVLNWLLCHCSQTHEQFEHLRSLMLEHLVQLELTLDHVIRFVGKFFALS